MLRFANPNVARGQGASLIHLVSGKGGVGKSTLAAALAWSLANQGRKTLLVELGERGYFRHLFFADIGAQPLSVNSHLAVTRWEGEACLREYLRHLIKIERVVNLFFDNRVMRALVQAAPALKELALLGKITSGPRKIGPPMPYDDVVVDAYATGHFRALWRAPMGLAEAIPFGPMGEQSRSIVATVKDPTLTRIYIAMIPEELPVTEGLELARDVERELGQKPTLLLNRWLESPIEREQLKPFAGQAFADYLSVLLERQSAAGRQVDASGLTAARLPWLFSNAASEKIQALAAVLKPLVEAR